MKLKVYRYHEGMDSHTYDTFKIEDEPGMTVLKALFSIQELFDDSLAFQYSCRGAVCGNCAMLINKVPRLACRTQVESLLNEKSMPPISSDNHGPNIIEWNSKEEILVEPLPNFKVIKDLVVDRSKFFKAYEFIEPVLKPSEPDPETERIMDPKELLELELYTNCILCGLCFGACPVDGKNSEYLGPAALAKLYRFHIDSRDGDDLRLDKADIPNGWWACEFHGNCRQVCPKGVPPIMAIGQARSELMSKKKNNGTD
jgi:succinate dehydrogenase / fumarate reductase iron-sulfur subunit